MANLKVAITGSSGLVGSRIVELLENDFDFLPLRYENGFDITNKESVENVLADTEFDLLLHLAAYTSVNKAETENEKAWQINVEGTKNVFETVKSRGKNFIYISTDFVFNGQSPDDIFDENSTPDPVGVYGTTKYEGEKVVNKDGMIVRISYPYRTDFPDKKDIVRFIRSLLEEGKELAMVTDSTMTLTFIDDIAHGLKHLMNSYSPEVFHLVGRGKHTPFDMAKLIAKNFHLDEKLILPTTFDKYFGDMISNRPQYTAIKSLKNNFQPMKSFEEGLEEMTDSLD